MQELLAPRKVVFLSADWDILGHKCADVPGPECHCNSSGKTLNELLARITQIPDKVLSKQQDPRGMVPEDIYRWARMRRTTKVEDLAYSLLGLLGVYMLPNYGERSHAWVRLEEEVQKKIKRDFSAPVPEQIRETFSWSGTDTALDVPGTESLGVVEDGHHQSDYVKSLIERHVAWVREQRAAELSLRREQQKCTRVDTTSEVKSQELRDHQLESQIPEDLGDELLQLESGSREVDPSNRRSYNLRPITWKPNTAGHPTEPDLSKLTPSMRSWLSDRDDTLLARTPVGGSDAVPTDNANHSKQDSSPDGGDFRNAGGGRGGQRRLPESGGRASRRRTNGSSHDRSAPGGAATSRYIDAKSYWEMEETEMEMERAKLCFDSRRVDRLFRNADRQCLEFIRMR